MSHDVFKTPIFFVIKCHNKSTVKETVTAMFGGTHEKVSFVGDVLVGSRCRF
jgi:hypothetical protein